MRTTLALVILLQALAGAALAQGGGCDDLRYQRNAIYKRAGYCFKTSDMIAAFGNAGCQYDDESDVPLSARDRDDVARISRLERTMGCR